MEVVENKEEQEGFDLVVHKRDAKTGKVKAVSPYRLFTINGIQYFEKPKGSGNVFFKSGDKAGRIEWTKDGKSMRVDEKAEHKEWKPAISADEQASAVMAAKDLEIEKLRKEVAAIKREQKHKVSAKESIKEVSVSAKGK